MSAQYPRLGVSSGIGGFYAVLYNAEEVIETGFGRYSEPAGAWQEARSWAASEGLPCDEERLPFNCDTCGHSATVHEEEGRCGVRDCKCKRFREPDTEAPKRKKKTAPLLAFDDSKGKQQCKSCHAPIWWYELVSGKRHPFDAQPDGSPPDYQMTEVDIPKYGRRLVAHIAAAVSHFATCPQSKDWKGKSR